MKNLQNIFNSYFHNKYEFEDFISTIPTLDLHITYNQFKNYSFYGYKKVNGNLTSEAKKLQDYHKFIELIFVEYFQMSDVVYSYSKNKKIYDGIAIHKDSKYYFKSDITNFFHSIDNELIVKTLKSNIPFLQIENCLEYIDTILGLISFEDRLPVGFSTSPKLSNAVLYQFDIEIEKYSQENNLVYSRYSDDLIFSTNNWEVLRDLGTIVQKQLDKIYGSKFQLNKEKTQFLDKTNRVEFLGMIITPDGHITVDKNLKENIKQLLYFFKNDKTKYEQFLAKYFDGKKSKAYGKLNYIYEIDKDFVLYLRRKYGNYTIDQFLHGTK